MAGERVAADAERPPNKLADEPSRAPARREPTLSRTIGCMLEHGAPELHM